ncbi:uncharacterized protein FIESC28_08147 [Fusarium coffeatum]|uniref:Uncharacterized protein n=1 Tax=Fusarium coffeatum TaxID=231269 RepID=A0A366R8N7_9HYPO|nr:uncharacterized protein FIESC28_08147 [Fusarium coffeatum]RBR13519.1 hypothetical protein FIESC28_08147 [Fusarium coffeatum]
MAQRTQSTSLASHAYRRGRPGRISPQSRHPSTASSVSSQESDSPSRFRTPLGTPTTAATRLPTPTFESGEDRDHKAFPGYILFHNTGRSVPSSDGEPGPSKERTTLRDKGKEPEVYEDYRSPESIATRLSRMENKLDLLLPLPNEISSREKQPSCDETLRTATEEQLQSSQIYRDLKAENRSRKEETEAFRTQLADSQQAQDLVQRSIQDLEAAKERSENEARECMAQAMNEYETLRDGYQWAKENWNRTADESDEAWDKAKEYERENDTLKQKISALEDANKELAGRIKAYDLEYIRRKESQKDGESQTEPDTEPTNMESRGTETSFIGWDPNADGEMEIDAEGELEPTEIQDGEQVEQDNRRDDQQHGLQDALQHDQHEVPQDISEGQEEQREAQQEDPQQEMIEGKLESEPHIQQTGEQEEPLKQLCDCQDEAQQDGTTSDSPADRKESEEDISHKEMLARGERQLERLMSTTQEPVVGRHTEADNMEQQEMIETCVGNDQPMCEAPAEHGPPEIQEVPLVGITQTITAMRDKDTDVGKQEIAADIEIITETETMKDITVDTVTITTDQETDIVGVEEVGKTQRL